ncbi:MAG: hypothetical protein ACXABK_06685, partial [Candidatus Heimdallarchaeaceae archaeon]
VVAHPDPIEILSFVFINPYTLFWGSFNGTRILQSSQQIFYSDPVNIDYAISGPDKTILISDYQDGSDVVNLYQGIFQGNQWTFSPIQSENNVQANFYSTYIEGENYIILYNTTVDTAQYSQGIGVSFREEEATALIIITNIAFSYNTYIEGLTAFNPIVEFFQTKWWILLIAVGVIAFITVAFVIIWRSKKKSIATFLTDKQVGEHSAFVLFFLNIGRLIGNAFSLVFSIWLSNKKRTLLTLAGFVITGYLLSSAIIIAQSEESAMIKAFDRSFPLLSDKKVSANVVTTFQNAPGENVSIPDNYHNVAITEVLDIYNGKVFDKYITGAESSYWTSLLVYGSSYPRVFTALPDDSDEFVSGTLYEGRVPINSSEVVINELIASRFDLEVNDTITLLATEDVVSNPTDFMLNATIVGIFADLNVAQTRKLSSYLGLPNDIYALFETADILTKESIFFDLLETGRKMNLLTRGYFQFYTSFDDFEMAERATLVSEQDNLQGKVFAFTFDTAAAVTIGSEMFDFFSRFNTYYLNNMARLLIFAIPAILLSIFMVFESSELFSSSYEKEIEILRDRGVKNRKLTSIYLSIRLIEVIGATLISFGLAVTTAAPLIKVNGFLSFNNPDTHLVIGNIPFELGIVALLLFVISVPRILMIVARRRRVEKVPSTIRKILDFVSWRDLFFVVVGGGLFYFFYRESFIAYYEINISNFTTYLFLTIAGAIFTLIGGLPIIIKLLSMIWKGIGYFIWRNKKTKRSFTFSEISKDIKYFENITLI